MHIGEIIKKYRTEHKLTMEEFGKLIGRSKAYISMLEKNKNSRSGREIIPSADTLIAVANVLKITIDDLIKQLDDYSPILLDDNPNSSLQAVSAPSQPLTKDADTLLKASKKDERDIQKRLQSILDDLDDKADLNFYNGSEEMDDETKELLRISIESSIRLAKERAKKKFTPKKYKKD